MVFFGCATLGDGLFVELQAYVTLDVISLAWVGGFGCNRTALPTWAPRSFNMRGRVWVHAGRFNLIEREATRLTGAVMMHVISGGLMNSGGMRKKYNISGDVRQELFAAAEEMVAALGDRRCVNTYPTCLLLCPWHLRLFAGMLRVKHSSTLHLAQCKAILLLAGVGSRWWHHG